LASERRYVEVTPRAPHRLVTAVVGEVRAEHTLAVAEKDVGGVPFVEAEAIEQPRQACSGQPNTPGSKNAW
jgi:hypothetical protein